MDTNTNGTADATQQGLFSQYLKRSNSKIRDDRANELFENAQLMYKRYVEDLQVQIRRLKSEQTNLLDLSPTDANSLTLVAEFDATKFVSTDVELGVKIRNLEIRYEIARTRFALLFGNGGQA